MWIKIQLTSGQNRLMFTVDIIEKVKFIYANFPTSIFSCPWLWLCACKGLLLIFRSCLGVFWGEGPTESSLPKELLLFGGGGAVGGDGRGGVFSTVAHVGFILSTSANGGAGRGGVSSVTVLVPGSCKIWISCKQVHLNSLDGKMKLDYKHQVW